MFSDRLLLQVDNRDIASQKIFQNNLTKVLECVIVAISQQRRYRMTKQQAEQALYLIRNQLDKLPMDEYALDDTPLENAYTIVYSIFQTLEESNQWQQHRLLT